jgi:AcrR family transcriptional regulator
MDQTNSTTDYNDSVKTAILEVSRELFARFGFKKTTMEDIAQALGKGKSSLYYYFKNKEEIFQAVIDWEETILFSRLRSVVSSSMTPELKMKYLEIRMETIRELENYHKALNVDNIAGLDFLDHLKGRSEKEEVSMIKEIMDEGVAKNMFQVKNTYMAAIALTTAFKGLEIPLFKSTTIQNFDEFKVQINNVLNILFYGLLKRD